MLNNLTNFFNLIVGRRIKTALENDDLIAVGTKQSPALGDYKPTAIRYEDLATQIAGGAVQSVTGLNTNNTDPQNPVVQVSVDGVTITGAGTPGSPLVANIPSAAVNYSNVYFVDAVNGNNATAALNDFTKPYISPVTAGGAAASMPGLSSTNRALVYVRRGEYSNPGTIVLYNNVDYYFEPGAYLTGAVYFRDNAVTVNSNVYGSVRINNTTGTTMLQIQGDSVMTFEFDTITSVGAAWYILPSGTANEFTIKGNYIYSDTLGQGWGIGFRNGTNAVVTITQAIEAIHGVIMWRFFTGNVTINCPNINLMPGNYYGGNNKQALIVYDAASNGKITVNGTVRNLDTVDYGGIGSLITFWSSPNTRFTLNGNAYGGVIKALDGNTYTSGLIEINGNLSSSKDYTAWVYGGGEVVIKNSVIINNAVAGPNYAIAVNGTGKFFLKDCYITNTRTDSDILIVNGASSNLVLDDCQLYSPGAAGASVLSSVGPLNIRAKNSMANKAVTADITNIYAPEGTLAVNTNVINPTSIN